MVRCMLSTKLEKRHMHKKADIDNLPVETEDENNNDDENSSTGVSSKKWINKKNLKLELSEVFALIKKLNQRNYC